MVAVQRTCFSEHFIVNKQKTEYKFLDHVYFKTVYFTSKHLEYKDLENIVFIKQQMLY